MACEDNNLKCLYLPQFNLRFISHPDTHLSLSHLLNLCNFKQTWRLINVNQFLNRNFSKRS